MVVIMPPFQVPDEPVHFLRAWGLSEGHLFQERNKVEILPSNVVSLPSEFPVGPILDTSPYKNFPKDRIWTLLHEKISSEQKQVIVSVPSLNPLAYLPQSIGVLFAKIAHFSPIGAFYLARFTNLIVAITLTFLAITLAPWGKIILLLVALFPVTISEMASVSPDALMISGSMIFIGLCLNLAERQQTGTSSLLAVLIVGAFLLNIKPGYFPLVGLVFLINPICFGSRLRYSIWTCSIVIAVCLVTALSVHFTPLAGTGVIPAVKGPEEAGADAGEQMRWVLVHPFDFLHVVIRTLGSQGCALAFMAVGKLGWLSIDLSSIAFGLVAALILLFVGGYPGDGRVTIYKRTVLLLTSIFTILSVSLSVYVAMSAVGGPIVVTLQGRYFTPVLPPFLLSLYCLFPKYLRLHRSSSAMLVLVSALVLVIVATMHAIWIHYP